MAHLGQIPLNRGIQAGDIDSEASDSGDVLTSAGDGTAGWSPPGAISVSEIDSGSATDGQVITADGSGGATWEDAGGGVAARNGAQAKQVTGQAISSATATAATLDGENWDTDSYHDPVTNNTRLTIPTGESGQLYLLTAVASFPNPGEAGDWGCAIRKNGTTIVAAGGHMNGTPEPAANSISIGASAFDVPTADGDYYEMLVYQTHSPSGGSATLQYAIFTIQLISA